MFKLNPGPTNNDDQLTISTRCSRGRCAALSARSAVLSIVWNANRFPFHNTSNGIPVHTTSIRRCNYNRSYMGANLNNLRSLNRVSQVLKFSRFCKNLTSCLLNARSVCNKTWLSKILLLVMQLIFWYHGNMVASKGRWRYYWRVMLKWLPFCSHPKTGEEWWRSGTSLRTRLLY